MSHDNFDTEILKDLTAQGYTGEELMKEFHRIKAQIRPAVEKLIAEAKQIARETRKGNRKDNIAEIFADLGE